MGLKVAERPQQTCAQQWGREGAGAEDAAGRVKKLAHVVDSMACLMNI